MPQRKSGLKALRQNNAKHMHNLDIKTDLKKTIKKFLASVKDKNTTEAKTNLTLVYKKLDKAAKRKIIEKNTAARRKSRFSKLLATV
ncbi:MAG: 30S ribosomal protein S20 [Omnitrophica WOR_2 bacterium GWC2_45_7]|nr:MAG: 30S ribosomal protein S20 [Omnitrophica WOR_2 bacterium GWA2_45_18]OGX20109.1 MAG: 30S ribosomal protein S20 [Omnitrophica WOR_2 bacterium GWC2_45_7]